MAFVNVVRSRSTGPYGCPCCGYLTLSERGGDEICPVCFWQDDGQDDHDAETVRGGPNRGLSLSTARENFRAIGATEERTLSLVRRPLPTERVRRLDAERDIHRELAARDPLDRGDS